MAHTRGFVLTELAAVVVVVAVLASILLAMGDGARRNGRIAGDLANLRHIGSLTRSYAADFDDLVWTFSWRPGNYTTHWPDLETAVSDMQATAWQAIGIMRDRGGGDATTMWRVGAWYPHPYYSHLPLLDYADEVFPVRWSVSPADRHRLKWIEDPACFRSGCFVPHQPNLSEYRWIYSTSYQMPPAFADPESWITQGNRHSTYSVGSTRLHGQLLTSVSHPSSKVLLLDVNARHFGKRQPFFGVADARIPLLMVDGSASVRASADANRGWHPSTPGTAGVTHVSYNPRTWEPATVSGNVTDVAPGRYRWTRMGIRGRDFGGPEVWP